MMTFSTSSARYGVGGGASRRMPKGSLMSGFEKPPRGRRLCPRRRTVDRATMRTDWDYLWKLALRLKIAGDVCVVRIMIADVGKSFMRIEHKYLSAKLVTNNVKRRNEIGITTDEGNCINIASEYIVKHVGGDIDICPLLFQFDDAHFAVGGFFALPALIADRRHPDFVPVVIALDDFKATDLGKRTEIDSLPLSRFGVVWICSDTCCIEFDRAKHMVASYQRPRERQWIKPFRALIAAEQPVVEIPRVDIDICLHFFRMLRPRPFRIGASPRIGRASRSDVNRLTGSVRILPNSAAWRKGGV